MKLKILKYISLPILIITVIITNSCGPKSTIESVIPADGARVKFLHAVQAGPPVVVFANGKKWSARLNTVANGPDSLVYGDTYPSIDYSVFPAGEASFEIKTPASANPAAATILTGKATLESGKYYTVIAADTSTKPRFTVIADDRSAIKSDIKTYLRFVNLLAGAPAAGYEFVYKRNNVLTTLATLKYGEAGNVVEFDPYPSGITVNDSLFVRVPGTTVNVSSFSIGTGLSANRLRTLIYRGRVGTAGLNTILNN
jgi:Domain of unknown function (DUF4397)